MTRDDVYRASRARLTSAILFFSVGTTGRWEGGRGGEAGSCWRGRKGTRGSNVLQTLQRSWPVQPSHANLCACCPRSGDHRQSEYQMKYRCCCGYADATMLERSIFVLSYLPRFCLARFARCLSAPGYLWIPGGTCGYLASILV